MATTLPEPHVKSGSPMPTPDETVNSERSAAGRIFSLTTSRVVAGLAVAASLLFVFFSYRPLWHTDVWGHLAYGRLIWTGGGIPTTEPLMPLAEGMRFVDLAWLSQIVLFGLNSALGVAGLQLFYAATITACVAILAAVCYRQSRSALLAIGGCAFFLWVEWQQLTIIRPQLAGMVCYMALLAMLHTERLKPRWIAIPLLFVVWANLHGSFIMGLVLLGAYCAGRAIDVLRIERSLGAVFRDEQVRQLLVLLELSAVAALVNPYGLEIYAEVVALTRNANVHDLVEWEPLTSRMRQGRAAGALALLLVVAYRLSPRRVSGAEAILVLGLGAATLWISRMIVWWTPIAVVALVVHANAALRQRRPGWQPHESPRSPIWAAVAAVAVVIGFACSSTARAMFGSEVPLESAVTERTPVAATKYLKEHPPEGLVFNDSSWGDYLLWAGPPGIQVFAGSHVHLLPHTAWRHYLMMADGVAEVEGMLDRYGVNTVVIDPLRRSQLTARLRASEFWRVGYEDPTSIVFLREDPEP